MTFDEDKEIQVLNGRWGLTLLTKTENSYTKDRDRNRLPLQKY